jgi:hypothetical protein
MLFILFAAMLAVPIALQWQVLHRRRRSRPTPLDLGVVFSWVGFLYGGLPLLGFALAMLGIGEIVEDRLGGELPADSEIFQVGLMYLMFNLGFALLYGWLHRRRPAQSPLVRSQATNRDVLLAVGILIASKAMTLALRAALGVQSADDYLGSYTELSNQPLIVQQVAGVLSATEMAVMTLVIVTVIARNPAWHLYMAALVVAQIVVTMIMGGSRTTAFAGALAYIVARSIYDRRMRLGFVAAAGAAGLGLFLLAGALRQRDGALDAVSGLYLLQGSEFTSVFINAVDLRERLADLDNPLLKLGLYLVDLLRFVPRQVIGDFKLDPASYYVTTFYPDAADAGAGLAFGVIAESAIGFGAAEAAVRGVLLGLAYGWVRKACLRRRLTVARAFVYTWFVVLAYQGLRDTTFSIFPRFAFQVAPLLLLLWALGGLGLRTRRVRRSRQPLTMRGSGSAPL